MYGRVVQSPGLQLRSELLESIQSLPTWHERLMKAMHKAHVITMKVLANAQVFQARQYNRKKYRSGTPFHAGNEVWCWKPTDGKNVTKLRHPPR